MTELSGKLDGVGLSAIVRFLVGLKKTGCLRVSEHDWQGEIGFENGQITHATLGSRSGLSALDALIEALPDARFEFDAQARAAGEPSLHVAQDVLLARIDELGQRISQGVRTLPPAAWVPRLATDDTNGGDEPVPLDRATLQTLIAVDGRRTVREIVAQRATFDVLWQLAKLAEMGLIRFEGTSLTPRVAEPEPLAPATAAVVFEPEPVAAEPEPLPSQSPASPIELPVLARCPKLGFEDDPSNAFNRPTRLHRCFAGATALPLSLDQQRELCLSDHYDTCPRLMQALSGPDARSVDESATDDPRIVRLPFGSRGPTLDRGPINGVLVEPTPLHTSPEEDLTSRPTPLRARMRPSGGIGGAAATAIQEPATEIATKPQMSAPPPSSPRPIPQALAEGPGDRRFGIPVSVLLGAVVVLAVVSITGYLLLPQVGSPSADDSVDRSALPNTALVEAGIPINDLTDVRPTPAVQPTNPTLVQTIPTTVPTSDTAGQPASAPVAPAAQPTPVAATPAVLLDETFTANDAGWRSDPQGTAVLTGGMYRVGPRQAGQFVAISAPIINLPADVIVGATFRKLAGPTGGGYGIIVRDGGQSLLDGTTQDGRYYVLEAGDKGEIGIWRREVDHWVDLLSWQHSDAVKPGTATNELSVRAIGNRLSLSVNGTQVASVMDTALPGGHAGIFVGGDGNQVGVSRFTIQAP